MIIKGTIVPLTALHIGWQRSFDPVDSDSPVIKDPAGRPFIPGSSFKGVLRSFIEGFVSGAEIKNYRPCFPTDDEYCIDREKWNDKTFVLENACPICRVFGGPYIGPKLKIKDMPVNPEKWHEAFLRVRDGIVIDRESRTAKDKGKYDFETVSPGIPFIMEMVADNFDDAEFGLLAMALDLISQGFGAIGGNVSRGLGRIKIDIEKVETLNPKTFFEQYKNQEEIAPDLLQGNDLEGYIESSKKEFFKYEWPEVKNV